MATDRRELAMRVAGSVDPGGAERVAAALRATDPGAAARLDPATGILHISTSRDSLEVEAALAAAGFDVTAATG